MLETKILDMPFAFTVQVVPYRSRRPRPSTAWATTPVRVGMVSSEDAPVAFEWIQQDSYDEMSAENREKYAPNGPRAYRVRSYEGRLYRATEASLEAFERDLGRDIPWISFKDHRSFGAYDYPTMPGMPRHEQGHKLPNHFTEWGRLVQSAAREKERIVGDDREIREAEAIGLLQDAFLVIDGTVWTTVGAHEPHYRVSSGANPDIAVTLNPRPIWYTADFPVGQREAAEAYARERGIERMSNDRVIVHMPESLTKDGAVLAARQALECLCMDVTNRNEGWPEEASRLVGEIRGIRNRSGELDLAGAVRILEDYDRLETLFAGMPETTDAGDMMRRVAPVVRRWREMERPNRPELAEIAAANDVDDTILNAL